MNLSEALILLEANIKKGKKFYATDCGICENVAILSKQFHGCKIREIVVKWKHFSGDVTYPIGSMEEYNTHKTENSLWKDQQLKLRLDLIKFLIKELKNETT